MTLMRWARAASFVRTQLPSLEGVAGTTQRCREEGLFAPPQLASCPTWQTTTAEDVLPLRTACSHTPKWAWNMHALNGTH